MRPLLQVVCSLVVLYSTSRRTDGEHSMGRAAEVVEINTDPAGVLAANLREEHGARITGELVVPAKAGQFAPLPAGLDARLVAALAGRGIDRLYTHQASAWDSVQAGRHSVVVTPTASGKTLCYNLPVLQAALTSEAKALYMFPTKALAQDQVAELTALNRAGSLG